MTLKDYYSGLSDEAKVEFRTKIVSLTRRNMVTFYRWLNDVNRPSYNDQKLIARNANVSVKDMFPPKTK